MRILVVEDEPVLRAQLAQAIAAAGHTVDSVADGAQAHYLGEVEDFDAVVLDLGLPVLDGLSVLRRWRTAGRNMPVLILTARDALHDRVQGLDMGADDYMVKPFELPELLARLRALLRRSQAATTAVLSFGRWSWTPRADVPASVAWMANWESTWDPASGRCWSTCSSTPPNRRARTNSCRH